MEIFQVVRIVNLCNIFVFLTTAYSTRPRWQRRRMEALARSDVFQLPRSSNTYRGWRAPRSYPICARPSP